MNQESRNAALISKLSVGDVVYIENALPNGICVVVTKKGCYSTVRCLTIDNYLHNEMTWDYYFINTPTAFIMRYTYRGKRNLPVTHEYNDFL